MEVKTYFLHQKKNLAKDRIINNSDIIVEKNPDIILVSWCGKKFKKDRILKDEDGIKSVQLITIIFMMI